MKKLFLSLIPVLLISYQALAQVKPVLQWAKAYGGTKSEDALSLIKGNNGGYVFAGDAISTDGDVTSTHGAKDVWVVSTDNTGHINWQKCFGGTNTDAAWCIRATEGGYIVAGITNSTDGDITHYHGGLEDVWIMKLSITGTLLWQKTYGGSKWDFANAITPTIDGGYIFTGGTTSDDGDVSGYHPTPTGTLQSDMWVVKIDDTGKIQWQKCLGGTQADAGTAIQQTTDSGYIIAGNTSSNDGDVTGYHDTGDIWIVKINDTGKILWQKCFGGTNFDETHSIKQTTDGGYIIGGNTTSNDGDVTYYRGGGGDAWVIKLTSTGSIDWQKTYGGSRHDKFWDILQIYDGGYIASGATNSTDGDVTGWHTGATTSDDFWVVRLSATGTLLWQKCLGGSSEEGSYAVIQVADSEFAVAGVAASDDGDVTGQHGSGFSYDAWLVNLKEEDTTTAVTTIHGPQNDIFVYPNPATQQITITHAAGLKAVINDVTGKNVLTIPITHNNQVADLRMLSPGSYYLRFYNKSNQLVNTIPVQKE